MIQKLVLQPSRPWARRGMMALLIRSDSEYALVIIHTSVTIVSTIRVPVIDQDLGGISAILSVESQTLGEFERNRQGTKFAC